MAGRRDVPLLAKILVTLALCVGIASVATYLFETRLTRGALTRQSDRLAVSHLSILKQAYLAQERSLDALVRNLAAEVTTRALTDPSRRNELDAELSISHRDRQLDLLEVMDTQGRRPVPPAGSVSLRDPPATAAFEAFDVNSHLLAATDGTYVQTVAAGVGRPTDRLILAGGYAFGDAFAYRLRTQIGDLGEIVLVAGGKVAGTTLHERREVPPGARVDGTGLPTSPTVVKVNGAKTLVVYAPIAFGSDGAPAGALGVALADPTASLDDSLARSRLTTSLGLAAVALMLGWLLFRSLIRPLVRLAHTATLIAGGDRDASFDIRGRDEIAMLGDSLARMTEESRAQAARITDTSRRIVGAQDEERHRIERNLHDGAQQRLLTASLAVGVVMAGRAAQDDARLAADLEDVARHLDLALAELRELARGIHPSILSEEGLGAALGSLAEKSTIPTTVLRSITERLPAPIEATAYFIVSEAIVNSAKHGHPSAVHVSASRLNGHLVVEVSDDGVGGADPVNGSGLVGLADRVAALGGQFTVESPPGEGTRIVAHLPCE